MALEIAFALVHDGCKYVKDPRVSHHYVNCGGAIFANLLRINLLSTPVSQRFQSLLDPTAYPEKVIEYLQLIQQRAVAEPHSNAELSIEERILERGYSWH
jgi:hypothetical protein